MPLKTRQKESLLQFYELRQARVQRIQAELATLIEGGDFSLAAIRARDLADALETLNHTANNLADQD